jgi:hypothetical protein
VEEAIELKEPTLSKKVLVFNAGESQRPRGVFRLLDKLFIDNQSRGGTFPKSIKRRRDNNMSSKSKSLLMSVNLPFRPRFGSYCGNRGTLDKARFWKTTKVRTFVLFWSIRSC